MVGVEDEELIHGLDRQRVRLVGSEGTPKFTRRKFSTRLSELSGG